jgi:hypothetical protein
LHENCTHYQIAGGRAIAVEKHEPFDYCTNEPDEDDDEFYDEFYDEFEF